MIPGFVFSGRATAYHQCPFFAQPNRPDPFFFSSLLKLGFHALHVEYFARSAD
jgi:hypothetical protein